jgi:hypothetical protein
VVQSIIAIDVREIVALWRQKAQHPQLGRPPWQASDDLERFVEDVVQALRAFGESWKSAEGCPIPRPIQSAARHGERRYHQRCGVGQVIEDFGLVYEAIAEVAARQGIVPGWREQQILAGVMDAATADATERHATLARAEWERQAREHFGTLAHEMRNALSSARMALEVLRRATGPYQRFSADRVASNLDLMANLVARQLGAVQSEASGCRASPIRLPCERDRPTAR